MKTILLLNAAIIYFSTSVYSQKIERIVIKGGTHYRESLEKTIFLYPAFLNGVINFRNGESFAAPMNYHKGLDQIYLIHGTDTVSISNNYEIKNVIIGKDSFYYFNKFIQVKHRTKNYQLGKQEKIKIANREPKMAYRRIPYPISSIESSSASEPRKQYGNMDVKNDLALIKYTTFYLGDKHNQFIKATRKNILYLSAANEKIVSKYLKEKAINLNKEGDLKKLLVFLESLQ
jgi:hypothetical protein